MTHLRTVLAATFAAAALPAAAAAAVPESRLVATADVGATAALNGELAVTTALRIGDHLTVQATDGTDLWTLVLSGPNGKAPTIGTYTGAVGLHERTASQAALWLGGPRQCASSLAGSFAITDLRTNGSKVERLHATFELTCTGDAGAQHGELRLLANHVAGWQTVGGTRGAFEHALGVSPTSTAWSRGVPGRPLTAILRTEGGATDTVALGRGTALFDLGGGYLVGDQVTGTTWDPVVVSERRRVVVRTPRGINASASNDTPYSTDGRWWQIGRYSRAAKRWQLRLRDVRTATETTLAAGSFDKGEVNGGYVSWSTCPANGGCIFHVRSLTSTRVRSVAPPAGRAYYGAGLAENGVSYLVDGPAKTCGNHTRIVRIDRFGRVTVVATLNAGVDAGEVRAARVGDLDRLLVTTVDCKNGRGVDTDVRRIEVDPAVLPPLR